MLCKKGVLKNFTKFTGKRLCQSLFFNKITGKRPEVLSCEFREIFKNIFFSGTPPVAPSVLYYFWWSPFRLMYFNREKLINRSGPCEILKNIGFSITATGALFNASHAK